MLVTSAEAKRMLETRGRSNDLPSRLLETEELFSIEITIAPDTTTIIASH